MLDFFDKFLPTIVALFLQSLWLARWLGRIEAKQDGLAERVSRLERLHDGDHGRLGGWHGTGASETPRH